MTVLSRFPMRPRGSRWVTFLGCLTLSITVLFLKKISRCFQSCFISYCSRFFFAKHLVSLVSWVVCSCTSQFHVYDTVLSLFPMGLRRIQWVPFLGCLNTLDNYFSLTRRSVNVSNLAFLSVTVSGVLLNMFLPYLELSARLLPSFTSMMTQFYRGFQWDLVEVVE